MAGAGLFIDWRGMRQCRVDRLLGWSGGGENEIHASSFLESQAGMTKCVENRRRDLMKE